MNSTALSKFTWGATDVGAVGTCAISTSRSPIDVTGIGQANQQFTVGVSGATVALDLFFDTTDHKTLTDNMISATSATAFTLTLVDTTTITGSGFVVSSDVVASTGDIVRASIVIQASGALTYLGTASFEGPME